eukprot:g17189.t1
MALNAWDECTNLWWRLLEAEEDLSIAKKKCEEIQREKERGRHVRAKRTEDDLHTASLHFLHLQQHLGLGHDVVCIASAFGALRRHVGRAQRQMGHLGEKLGLPGEVWQKVVNAALPSLGSE